MSSESIGFSDKFSDSQFASIALCHKKAFPNQLLSRAGVDILVGFYKLHYKYNEIIHVAIDNESIIGFVLGGKEIYINEYRRIFLKTKPFLFMFALLRKEVLVSGLKYLKGLLLKDKNLKVIKIPHNFYYLSVIAVDSKYHGKSISLVLLNQFEKKCLEKGFSGYYLNVATNNERAMAFYLKQNMQVLFSDKFTTTMIKTLK